MADGRELDEALRTLSPAWRQELEDMAKLFGATWTPQRWAGRLECVGHIHDDEDRDDFIVD
jgi:hypothetical protein